MNDKPIVPCPKCQSIKTHKVPSLCGIVVKHSLAQRKANDRFRREGAMRLELKERYGVEKVVPLGGRGITDVYHDVKAQGDYVREEMARASQERAAKTREKQREWKRKAVKRATPRRLEMERRRAAEEFAKRAIRL